MWGLGREGFPTAGHSGNHQDGDRLETSPRAPVNWGEIFFPTKACAFAGKDSPCTPSHPAAFGTHIPPSP